MINLWSQCASWQRQHAMTLTLLSVVLAAATFGFAAAGLWYQFCLEQGEPELAAAFADLAPPQAAILLAGVGLMLTVAAQLADLSAKVRQVHTNGATEPTHRSPTAPGEPAAAPEPAVSARVLRNASMGSEEVSCAGRSGTPSHL